MMGFGSFDPQKKILGRLGTPDQAMGAIDMARHGAGKRPPDLEGLSPEDLAVLDRLAWGRTAKEKFGSGPATVMGLGALGPYELLKAGAQSNIPLVGSASRGIMGGFGSLINKMGGPGDLMKIDKTTSPASLRNFLAFLEGAEDEERGDAYTRFPGRIK